MSWKQGGMEWTAKLAKNRSTSGEGGGESRHGGGGLMGQEANLAEH